MHRHLFRAVLAASVALAASLSVSAQTRGGAPPLTTQDYIDIQQIVARYTFLVDTCSNAGYDFADLFTADGEFSVSQQWGVAGGRKIKGREALADRLGQ
jgi:hypothetical protein